MTYTEISDTALDVELVQIKASHSVNLSDFLGALGRQRD